jgi:hypothetical protein
LLAPGSRTNWAHVRRTIAEDLPIPYDPEDGPYDPNDDEAVEAYWKDALIVRGDGTILQQPGPAESPKTVL